MTKSNDVSEEGSLGTKIVNVVTSRQTDRRVNFFPNGSEHREYFFKTLNRLLTTFSTFYVSLKGVVAFDVIFAWFSRWLLCNTALITYQNRLRNSAFILV